MRFADSGAGVASVNSIERGNKVRQIETVPCDNGLCSLFSSVDGGPEEEGLACCSGICIVTHQSFLRHA